MVASSAEDWASGFPFLDKINELHKVLVYVQRMP